MGGNPKLAGWFMMEHPVISCHLMDDIGVPHDLGNPQTVAFRLSDPLMSRIFTMNLSLTNFYLAMAMLVRCREYHGNSAQDQWGIFPYLCSPSGKHTKNDGKIHHF